MQIRSSLHFVDEKDCNKEDFLYKVRDLVNYFITVSRSLYIPEQMLTIDESMIRFNGRSNFKVYMPLKPIKYGFKAYVLAEASTGFVLSWELHDGRNTSLLNILDSLTSAFANQGYRISMGGFYTTLTIVEHLTNNGFEVLGTITSNRAKLSQEIKDKSQKLKKGESNFYCS